MPGAGGNPANAPLIMEYDSRDCLIEHNEFYNAVGSAVFLKDNARNITVRYNLFWGRGSGITGPVQDSGQNIVIHNNVFRGLSGAAVATNATGLKGFLVFNNTFFNNRTDFATWTAGHKDIRVFNNIFSHAVAGQRFVNVVPHSHDPTRDGALPNVTFFDFNCYHGPAVWRVNYRTAARTLREWQSYGTYGFDRHSFLADPGFLDPEKGDFRLRSDSPCRRAGKDGATLGAFITGREQIGVGPATNPWAEHRAQVSYVR